ncbi:MAG: hypothetical protein EU550_01870 [Promethearchaeota archaeon]|nr:MAG: hypothetical protein EU550_01870 [Candidatus Lokiarchaeota archaeon]
MLELKYRNDSFSEIRVSEDLSEIEKCLENLLYVPDLKLKPEIIFRLINHLKNEFSDQRKKLRIFIAYDNNNPVGFIIGKIDLNYRSYGRKSGTFGWLIAKNFETCKSLIERCERFMKNNKIRRLRGPINFPKGLGGMGIQTKGFYHDMMYGVAFGDPNSNLITFLDKLGFKRESKYTCVYVLEPDWKKGQNLSKKIELRYLTLDEIYEKKNEIHELANDSFQVILPDRSGFDDRFEEMIDVYSQIPKSFYKLKKALNYEDFINRPQFSEAWKSCNIEKVINFAPMAFDKRKNKLIGAILSFPDLYQVWLNQSLTRVNVDTVMIHKDYAGKGIFSNLTNIGRLTLGFFGINYVEGTYIWSNNKKAIETIFPHSLALRTHYVVQKKL